MSDPLAMKESLLSDYSKQNNDSELKNTNADATANQTKSSRIKNVNDIALDISLPNSLSTSSSSSTTTTTTASASPLVSYLAEFLSLYFCRLLQPELRPIFTVLITVWYIFLLGGTITILVIVIPVETLFSQPLVLISFSCILLRLAICIITHLFRLLDPTEAFWFIDLAGERKSISQDRYRKIEWFCRFISLFNILTITSLFIQGYSGVGLNGADDSISPGGLIITLLIAWVTLVELVGLLLPFSVYFAISFLYPQVPHSSFLPFLIPSSQQHSTNPAPPPQGLTSIQLSSLPSSPHHRSRQHDVDLLCAICLNHIAEGENIRSLPRCLHPFHTKCIDNWLTRRGTCPCCINAVVV